MGAVHGRSEDGSVMPLFNDNIGADGFLYRDTPKGKALRLRHATFWSALTSMGLSVALRPRCERPREVNYLGICWTSWNGDYGLTGEIAIEGPFSLADVRLLIDAATKSEKAA
jgi:hypothetical protein